MAGVSHVEGLHADADSVVRCWWAGEDAEYQRYHDEEWGRPVDDDQRLFEKICLEGFQSGLSWLTILRKRPAFREAFSGFAPHAVAKFDQTAVDRLLSNAAIVRHRGKIDAAINNAQCMPAVVADHGSFASFIWQFEPSAANRPERFDYASLASVAVTPESTALAKALKSYGFHFVGPTTAYAFMQSMGLVNDHLAGCSQRVSCDDERARFHHPSGPPLPT